MRPQTGRALAHIPIGTEWLLLEHQDDTVTLLAPLVAGSLYTCLRGQRGRLWASCDAGRQPPRAETTLLAYTARGKDVFSLIRAAAQRIAARLGSVDLRRDQPAPRIWNRLAWCTWNAFYRKVSHDLVIRGLHSLQQGGITPATVIIDDGWQETEATGHGEERLLSFGSNDKFPGGLASTVQTARRRFEVQDVFAWHALHGYWAGLSERNFGAYALVKQRRAYPPEVLAHQPKANADWAGAEVVYPTHTAIRPFLDDYHSALAKQGITGVKLDNLASLDGLTDSIGRVELAAATREALEASVERHFPGRSIACMSCTTSLLYRTRKAGVVRSSIDFWPEHADSHGQHAHTNAVFSLWFGEFVWPDWDMFQTAHLAGAYHAALRAVSGSSLCIADAPGHHDFDLLRKLLTRSGQTLRAEQPGVPTRDSLFADVREGPNLLKIWNRNRHSGVVGLFNARREPDRSAKGWLAAHDVPTLQGNAFALYFHQSRALVRASKRARCAVSLSALQWEVVTIVPIVAGFAPIGLTDKLNSGASIKHVNSSPGICRFGVVDDGPVLVWCARKPREVQVDGRKHAVWSYENHALSLDISSPGEHRVVIVT